MIVHKDNVVFNTSLQRKLVMTKDRPMAINENFVCDNPHEDGDYSYMCSNTYCRCHQ
jgi:hypothetical protein